MLTINSHLLTISLAQALNQANTTTIITTDREDSRPARHLATKSKTMVTMLTTMMRRTTITTQSLNLEEEREDTLNRATTTTQTDSEDTASSVETSPCLARE